MLHIIDDDDYWLVPGQPVQQKPYALQDRRSHPGPVLLPILACRYVRGKKLSYLLGFVPGKLARVKQLPDNL